MNVQNIPKISPIVEITSPVLLQCKDGECGTCPRNTGKMIWIPKDILPTGSPDNLSYGFNFQYNFFNKAAESEDPIKYNWISSTTPFGNRPTKQYAIDTPAIETYMSPSQMRLGDTLFFSPANSYISEDVGCWIFFRQPNPAISNVHDALCFEYNHEKRLITFRSF